jgi:hypothetical protein
MSAQLEANREMVRLSQALEDRLDYVRDKVHEYASAEAEYRKARAVAWLNTPTAHADGSKITAKEREDMVNADTADQRERRDIADGLKQAGYEAVRSARQQLSAWQSRVAADREEMSFARTGPR